VGKVLTFATPQVVDVLRSCWYGATPSFALTGDADPADRAAPGRAVRPRAVVGVGPAGIRCAAWSLEKNAPGSAAPHC
jgi:hypothetical protein